jgi:2-oxoglutarate dehydrogenase E2 component (dihydrolipoamide succinyltransferase)
VELLAKEEDTVSVGQDLFRFEPGECTYTARAHLPSPEAINPVAAAASPTSKETASDASKSKEPSDQQVEKKLPAPPPPPPRESSDKRPSAEPKKEDKKKDAKSPPSGMGAAATGPGSRNETRVSGVPDVRRNP